MSGDEVPVIRPLAETDVAQVVAIARGLPVWFTAAGLAALGLDLASHRGLVADLGSRIAGFVTFFIEGDRGRIGWMAVRAGMHRRGIGTSLIRELARTLSEAGVVEIHVKTLGDSVNYEPYARSRAFYRKLGFTDFDRVFSSNPECEELLTLRRLLSSSRRTQ